MPKARHILGMNARNLRYTHLNPSSAKAFTNSKFATKALLANKNIPTAKIIEVFTTNEDIYVFDWQSLEKNFVIKPTNGNAGKGVLAIRRKNEQTGKFIDVIGRQWSIDDLKLHCSDILDGQYSTYGEDHRVIIEERVPIHPKLLKYTFGGTPDIRVIVYNQVPVMAMLRLPTEKSEGRANLTQGAIGVGIDLATGVTTHAVKDYDTYITTLPDSKRKLSGIQIPFWKKTLQTAVEAALAAGLAYSGIDLFLHEEKGPMVVELNANPGLSIQFPNKAGLRRRLERVEELQVLNPEHGVRIAQALFAERFSDKIKSQEGLKIIGYTTDVTLHGDDKKSHHAQASIQTGKLWSTISLELAESLALADLNDFLWYQSDGEYGDVPVVQVKLKIADAAKRTVAMKISKRLNKKEFPVEIGRRDLQGFLIGEVE